MDEFFNVGTGTRPAVGALRGASPDTDAVARIAGLVAKAERPVLVLGTDVWADHAEAAALRLVEEMRLPAITNGMGRGVVPGGHPLLVTKARGAALGGADLVVVVGTPLDFRLGYGVFGGKDGATPAAVVHVADSAEQALRARRAGRLRLRRPHRRPRRPAGGPGRPPAAAAQRLDHLPAGHRRRGRRARRGACSVQRRTRSTRRGSTASWCPGSPTTPS
nr:hypothetical protein [Nocardioides convexus]